MESALPHGARMYRRFKARLWQRRAAALVYLSSAVIYLGWRATIINNNALFLSGMYYLADLIAVLLGAVTVFVSWNYWHRTSPAVPLGLNVDVFIPTYREPIDMVARTVRAALAIRYPHETWLLDDGNRQEMRDLADEVGCHYLSRPENRHAKAGNLNNALAHSRGEFVAVFDADHIPQTNAIDAMLGFFTDPNVGMVQAPQDYYNISALQYMNKKKSGALWHDQSFFYNISQPGRDYWEATSCAGTSVIYRRSALETIGGIPVETVTEDIHTSLKLHKAGFQVPYLNEPVAYGIAAADLADYYRTRLRYGHGNIHALRKENVFFCKGLTFKQRLSYLFLGLIYLEGWQQLMVFLVPSLALIFGLAPFDITIFNVLLVMVFPLWSYLLMQEIGCGFSRYWTAEIFSMMRFPIHLVASAALFRNRMPWRVSQKNVEGRFSLVLLAPQIFVLVLSLTAVAFGVYRLHGNYRPGPIVSAFVDRLPEKNVVVAGLSNLAASALELGDWIQLQLRSELNPGTVIAKQEGAPAVIPARPAPQPQTATRPPRPPPPVNWFKPFTKGYTIDLVLIAGFWALLNALRVLFVIVKVARNARDSRRDYLFQTNVPIRFETPRGPRYGVVDQLSSSRAVVGGRFRDLPTGAAATPIAAIAYLPSGTARLRLRINTQGASTFWRRRQTVFDLEPQSEADRRILEDGLYMTGWHRECRHTEAEFATPLATLGSLLRLRWPRLARSQWRPVLYAEGSTDPTDLALLRQDRRSGVALLTIRKVARGTVLHAIVPGSTSAETKLFAVGDLLSTPPLHSQTSPTQPMYVYGVTEVSAAPAEVAIFPRRSASAEKRSKIAVPATALGNASPALPVVTQRVAAKHGMRQSKALP